MDIPGKHESRNGTRGRGYHSSCYGLFTDDTSSTIHLLFPLTKECVSTNNHEGRNYCPETEGTLYGTIETVKELSD